MENNNIDKFCIALKIKAKHGMIYNYMTEHNLTYKTMSMRLKISKATLCNILNFHWMPKKGKITATIKKLTNFFGCSIKDLFPPELVKQINNNKEIKKMLQGRHVIQKNIDIKYLPFNKVPEIGYTHDFVEFAMQKPLQKTLDSLLDDLNPRERMIIRGRFGFDGGDGDTYGEIAKKLGLSTERIRQIEAKALKRLRYPRRLKLLKEL